MDLTADIECRPLTRAEAAGKTGREIFRAIIDGNASARGMSTNMALAGAT